MKIFIRSIAILLVGISLFACGGGNPSTATDNGSTPKPTPDPKPAPETSWNKDRTFEVLVLNNPSSADLAQSDSEYISLAEKIKGLPQNSYSMIILEQANMIKGSNPALSFPLPLNQFAYFNLHRYSNETVEAGMVLSKSLISETNQHLLADSSYLLQFDLTLLGTSEKALSFPLQFCTFRLASMAELRGLSNLLEKLTNARKPHLFMGLVSNSIINEFKSTCAGIGTYEMVIVEPIKVKDYCYIFFAPKSYRLRETKEAISLGNIKGMKMAVEVGVSH